MGLARMMIDGSGRVLGDRLPMGSDQLVGLRKTPDLVGILDPRAVVDLNTDTQTRDRSKFEIDRNLLMVD